jgi:ribA/ribD-fused uncharacterized protein
MPKYIKNWFSNMLPLDEAYIYENILYETVENFYQAMKTLNIEDRKIISKLSPFKAKKYGRKIKLREDWGNIKCNIMMEILQYKFKKGTSWYKKLKSCQDKVIVEYNNWHDNYWGDCLCDKCAPKKGGNILGQMLTFIRDGECYNEPKINKKGNIQKVMEIVAKS